MRAIIFAAGLGTRLKPFTDTMPKALFEVCGQTLLERLINKFKDAGFNEIVINVHHFANKIKDYLAQNNNFSVKIYISNESDLLRETGGGIRYAAALLNDGEPFFVHNVDILSNLDFDDFYQAHLANSISIDTPLATLLVSDRQTSRYFLFDTDNNLVGWMNTLSGEVKSPFAELRKEASPDFDYNKFLQENSLNKYAFAGTHIISPHVFRLMQNWPDKFSIVDFYLAMADKYIIKAYIKNDLQLVDVGKLESLSAAEEFVNNSK